MKENCIPINFFAKPIEGKGEIYTRPQKITITNNHHKLPSSGKILNGDNLLLYREIEYSGNLWMERACTLAKNSIKLGGGPFGAIVLQLDFESDEIIRYWEASNKVTILNDPTAHAEIIAIRSACNSLGAFDLGKIVKENSKLFQPGKLSYCIIISSCEPCPMCLSAIYWARINELYFSATRFDAAQPGVDFSDENIYMELEKKYSERKLKTYRCPVPNSVEAFILWKNSGNTGY